MVESEHFANKNTFTFGTGLTMVIAAFSAQASGWQHWIAIGIGYGAGIVLMLLAAVWITRSYYLRSGSEVTLGAPPKPEVLIQPSQGTPLFSPLQMEAFQLDRDLARFVVALGKRPEAPEGSTMDQILQYSLSGEGGKWFVRMKTIYQDEFAPRVRTFVSHLGREGRANSRLNHYTEQIGSIDHVNTVRAQLWREAIYPEGIDFQGE